MRKFALLLVLTCGLVAVSGSRAALTVTNTRALVFGEFVAGNGGTVTISTAGARTSSGGVFLIGSAGGTAAAFNIVNDSSDLFYHITLPDTVTLTSGANSMTLSNFVSNPAAGSALDNNQILTVGATLTVSPNQSPGAYSGTFDVFVDYE